MDGNYSRIRTWDACLHRLFETKHFSDITLVAEFGNDSTSFPAHKLILATSSPTFAEMFYDPKAAATNHIIHCNVRPEAVELMLTHIYFRKEVQFESLQQCFGVLSLATIYELSILRNICTNYIEGFIDVEHVCSIYQTAMFLRNSNLVLKSLQLMQKETSEILKQDSWRNALPEIVEAIVKQNYLNVDSELRLFEAVVDWAKRRLGIHGIAGNAERLRQAIEPFLPYFRFFNMDTETFLIIAATTQIFNSNEIASISLNFVQRNSCQLPVWFNSCTNCRSYEYQASGDTCRNNWFNINRNVYSRSEQVEKISSIFRAKSNGFAIHQLWLAICDDCFACSRRSRRPNTMVKATVKVDTDVREKTVMLPTNYCIKDRQELNFDKSESAILASSHLSSFISTKLQENVLVRGQYWNMETCENIAKRVGTRIHTVIIQPFPDPDAPRFSEVINLCSSTLSVVIDLEPPVIVRSEKLFTLSLETTSKDEPFFFCCKKKSCFQGAPFFTHTIACQETEDESEVWCAFASLGYCVPMGERVLCE